MFISKMICNGKKKEVTVPSYDLMIMTNTDGMFSVLFVWLQQGRSDATVRQYFCAFYKSSFEKDKGRSRVWATGFLFFFTFLKEIQII